MKESLDGFAICKSCGETFTLKEKHNCPGIQGAAMKPETQPWMKDAAKLAAAEIERKGCYHTTVHCAVNPRCQEVRDEDAATILTHLAAHAPQQWIPVSERLPETTGEYIACQRTGVCTMYFHADHAEGPRFHFNGVTHWMPLPAPPVPDKEMK